VQHDAQAWSDRKSNNMPTADKLHHVGFDSLHDMLVSPPLRYIDRSNPQDVRELLNGEHATIVGRITDISERTSKLTIVTVTDRNGSDIECQYFNVSRWIKRTYRVGDDVIVNGVYKPFITSRAEYPKMQHPTIDFADTSASPVIPVYHQSQKYGVSNWMISSCVNEIVDRIGAFKGPQWLEDALMDADISTPKDSRVPYGEALKKMHKPDSLDDLRNASRSLAFCELVEMLTIVESQRHGNKPLRGMSGRPDGSLTDAYLSLFPYDLTDAQRKAVESIDDSMRKDTPMHALLVGDVGSGKTTVIHLAALKSIEEGHQAVICAPTEILAMQLYDVFMGLYENMPVKVKDRIHPLLNVHYKGKGAAARRKKALKDIADGSANLVFGTHAVFSDNIEWHDLGFIGIDEQHKFGASQRSILLNARHDDRVPDMLMQTATPIPRSIAQVYYGDVNYLKLDEMPSGRLPIRTEWMKYRGSQLLSDVDNPIWKDIISEARQGHGTFIICPMVDDSPKVDAASVKESYAVVNQIMSSHGIRCSMVYGSQAEDEQHQAIEDFKAGRTQVLVASSVVEVGVSCEHASRMVILDANRFGLASLHQIRGRIGRGTIQSVCYLVGVAYTQSAINRMDAITSTLDGWSLSKADLKNRGAGTLLHDSQSGSSDFRYADLVDNADWIAEARRIADNIIESPKSAEALRDSRKWFDMSSDDAILS
jgi:ATP-dependent DNA helicase RecG